jgi:hypothetical protein
MFILFKKIIMKKLLYLLFAIILLGCGSDDDISVQTFFEKYDGVVWQDQSTNDSSFYNKIQFKANKSTKSFDGVNCKSVSILSDKISSVGENTFTFTDNKYGTPESDIFTVSSDGLTLNQEYVIGTESYDENYKVYKRTNLNDPCE